MSPWQVALRVTLRRSLGAIAAAGLAVLVLTAGDMSVTDLLSVRTYAEESYTQYQSGNSPRAALVALPPMVAFGALILVGVRALLKVDPARVLSAASPVARLAAGPVAGAGGPGGRGELRPDVRPADLRPALARRAGSSSTARRGGRARA